MFENQWIVLESRRTTNVLIAVGIVTACVLICCCGPCTSSTPAPAPATSQPEEHGQANSGHYPVVTKGTLLSFSTDDGMGTVAVIYSNEGRLAQQYFYVCYDEHECPNESNLDIVKMPPPVPVPGDSITITRTDNRTYTIAKEE